MNPSLWRDPLKRGDVGADVEDWQEVLEDAGLAVGTIDRDFGSKTEKATIQFQLDRHIVPAQLGQVDERTRDAIGQAPLQKPEYPGIFDSRWHFVQARGYTPAGGRVVTLIVMHAMQSPDRPDTAEGVAAWFGGLRGTPPRASAHACCDEDSIVQCVMPHDIAWGAQGGNWPGYHIEQAGYSEWTRGQWLDETSARMLDLAASHVKLALGFFDLPSVELNDLEVAICVRDSLIRQGKIKGTLSGHPGGICQHSQITKVWQGFATYGLPDPRKMAQPFWPDHTDCGPAYPIDQLMARVSA